MKTENIELKLETPKEVDIMNLELYKKYYEEHIKFKNKIVRALDTETLIKELKRRKILSIDWLNINKGIKYKEGKEAIKRLRERL